jgi:hypothetical protein
MIAIARPVMDSKRDQLKLLHCRAVGQAQADYTGPATGGRAALKAPRLERVTRQLHLRALVRLRNTRNVSRSESLSIYGSGSVGGEVTLGSCISADELWHAPMPAHYSVVISNSAVATKTPAS